MFGSRKKGKVKEVASVNVDSQIDDIMDSIVNSKTDDTSSEEQEITIGLMKDENYGELLDFVKDINVTDINWNGRQLWIDDLVKGRYMSKVVLSPEFIVQFSLRVSNVVSEKFNKYNPKLEAETEELRISIIHESVAHTGRTISIRKTPAVKRIVFKDAIDNGKYCSVYTANLMSNAVKSKMNIVICGLPGVGKTELLKYLTGYIFPWDRVITLEDSLEIHYCDINPNKDGVEMKVDDNFTYVDAIKASLRQLPTWIMLSEARSVEVKYLLEALTTGTHCLTTIHTDDVRKLADRIKNMIGDSVLADRVENEVYSFIDMAILVSKRVGENGSIERFIDQVASFDRENGVNTCNLIYNEGKRTDVELQESFTHKMKLAGINNPYEYTFI